MEEVGVSRVYDLECSQNRTNHVDECVQRQDAAPVQQVVGGGQLLVVDVNSIKRDFPVATRTMAW